MLMTKQNQLFIHPFVLYLFLSSRSFRFSHVLQKVWFSLSTVSVSMVVDCWKIDSILFLFSTTCYLAMQHSSGRHQLSVMAVKFSRHLSVNEGMRCHHFGELNCNGARNSFVSAVHLLCLIYTTKEVTVWHVVQKKNVCFKSISRILHLALKKTLFFFKWQNYNHKCSLCYKVTHPMSNVSIWEFEWWVALPV